MLLQNLQMMELENVLHAKSYALWRRLGYDTARYVMMDCQTGTDQLHMPTSLE